MAEPKRHHYVSQFILRNFADENQRLHFFSRLWPEPKVQTALPDKIFLEKYLYSSVSVDGTKDARLEKAYSALEGAAKPLLQKIIEGARQDLRPTLSVSERDELNKFLYHHIKRSPDFVGGRSAAEFEHLIEKATDEYIQDHHSLSELEISELQRPVVRDRMIQNATVIARSRGSAEVGAAFASRGIGVAKIKNSKKSFVIGSHPYAQLKSPGIFGIPAGAIEIWFPLSSDVAITFFGNPFSEHFVQISDQGIRAINEKTALSSNVIAGRSEPLIQSLSRRMTVPLSFG